MFNILVYRRSARDRRSITDGYDIISGTAASASSTSAAFSVVSRSADYIVDSRRLHNIADDQPRMAASVYVKLRTHSRVRKAYV